MAGDAGTGISTRRAVTATVAVVAVASLLARLYGLGARTAHWDEARMGYWTLRYLATGAFEYRPVAGGPLLYVVDRHVFALLGADDFSARLVVAIIGGALPLTALLFRRRLRASETVLLSVFLGVSPLFLYYSRFLRGDLPLAAFALVTIGCAVRYRDGEGNRYLYGAAAALALSVAASGFAVAYLCCWLFAGGLLYDHRRLLGGTSAETAADGGTVAAGSAAAGRRWSRWLRTEADAVAKAVGVYALVHLFFFAPRAGSTGGPGLWQLETFPTVLLEAFVGAARKFIGVRVVARGQGQLGHSLLPYVTHHVELLVATSLPLVVLALGAFLADRYGGGPPRPLMAFSTYWAGTAVLVFAVATEVRAPWVALHIAVPLSIPAAVGGRWVLRAGADAFERDRADVAVAVVLLVLAAVAGTGAVAATAYEQPTPGDRLVDDAQPGSDLDPFVADVSVAIAGNQGTDVLFYGEGLALSGAVGVDQPPVRDAWGKRLPLPWYLERLGAETASATSLSELARAGPPPVVVAEQRHRATLESRLGEGYRATTYDLSLWDRTVVVFVSS